MNDIRTISAIIRRDEAAISDVIKKYAKLLWSGSGAVLNNIGSTQDVEECVADTFIYLFMAAPGQVRPEARKTENMVVDYCKNAGLEQIP